ncbi:MAG TPA: CoA-binding protein [Myxococcales bacterium]|nr:CoA-binding protein [Myxococcales bacterium]
MDEWRRNLIEDDEARIAELLRSARRVAVLGIKTEAQSGQPAYYVPAALQKMGLSVVPVPVYFPAVQEILGEKVYRKVSDVPFDIDIVDVFRRSADVAQHLSDLLAKRPRAVWLQSGIRDDRTAEALARAGILVVQDRCLMVDYRAIYASNDRGRERGDR